MKLSQFEKEKCIAENNFEFGRGASFLPWIDESQSQKALSDRDTLLKDMIKMGASTGCSNTKIDTRFLSPGCRICAEGAWSCLFINNLCNASCFYCPTSQKERALPGTHNIDFTSPEQYAEYVDYFQFKGASISGGEPFLSFEESRDYIQAVRRKMGQNFHIWLYTNGKLVTAEKLKILKQAGLNEIRFDIGAVDYSLEPVKAACGIIDTVTVEIPALPDEKDRLKSMLPAMKEAGVSFLNLHQLRATGYNIEKLLEKEYQLVHGPRVTVFGSEMTALEIISESISTNSIPVNYCSFIYKQMYQQSATRIRLAKEIARPHQYITENGYIRSIICRSDGKILRQIVERMHQQHVNADLFSYASGDKLACSINILPSIASFVDQIEIHYASCRLSRDTMNHTTTARKLDNCTYNQFFIESADAVKPLKLTKQEASLFYCMFREKAHFHITDMFDPDHDGIGNLFSELTDDFEKWATIYNCERIRDGFIDYF